MTSKPEGAPYAAGYVSAFAGRRPRALLPIQSAKSPLACAATPVALSPASAVRGVRRCKGRVIAAEAEESGGATQTPGGLSGVEPWPTALSELLEKALFATVVGPFHTNIPPPAMTAELPVTVLLLIFIGPPPAKMPPPTNAIAVGLDDGVVDCGRARVGRWTVPHRRRRTRPGMRLFETRTR